MQNYNNMFKPYYTLLVVALFITSCSDQKAFELTVLTQKLGKKVPNEIIALNIPLSSSNCEKVEFITDKDNSKLVRIDQKNPFEFVYKKEFRQMNKQTVTEVNAKNQMEALELLKEFDLENATVEMSILTGFLNKISRRVVFVYSADIEAKTINIADQECPVFTKMNDLKKALSDSLCVNGSDKKYVVLYNLELAVDTTKVAEVPKVDKDKKADKPVAADKKTTETPKTSSGTNTAEIPKALMISNANQGFNLLGQKSYSLEQRRHIVDQMYAFFSNLGAPVKVKSSSGSDISNARTVKYFLDERVGDAAYRRFKITESETDAYGRYTSFTIVEL